MANQSQNPNPCASTPAATPNPYAQMMRDARAAEPRPPRPPCPQCGRTCGTCKCVVARPTPTERLAAAIRDSHVGKAPPAGPAAQDAAVASLLALAGRLGLSPADLLALLAQAASPAARAACEAVAANIEAFGAGDAPCGMEAAPPAEASGPAAGAFPLPYALLGPGGLPRGHASLTLQLAAPDGSGLTHHSVPLDDVLFAPAVVRQWLEDQLARCREVAEHFLATAEANLAEARARREVSGPWTPRAQRTPLPDEAKAAPPAAKAAAPGRPKAEYPQVRIPPDLAVMLNDRARDAANGQALLWALRDMHRGAASRAHATMPDERSAGALEWGARVLRERLAQDTMVLQPAAPRDKPPAPPEPAVPA